MCLTALALRSTAMVRRESTFLILQWGKHLQEEGCLSPRLNQETLLLGSYVITIMEAKRDLETMWPSTLAIIRLFTAM